MIYSLSSPFHLLLVSKELRHRESDFQTFWDTFYTMYSLCTFREQKHSSYSLISHTQLAWDVNWTRVTAFKFSVLFRLWRSALWHHVAFVQEYWWQIENNKCANIQQYRAFNMSISALLVRVTGGLPKRCVLGTTAWSSASWWKYKANIGHCT
jgi:hypothetical protein